MNMNKVDETGEYDKDHVHEWSICKYGSKKNPTLIRCKRAPIATDKVGADEGRKGLPNRGLSYGR